MDTYPPPEVNTKSPGFNMPPGACDTQIHIYGPTDRYPLKPDRVYEPHLVGIEEVLRMHKTLGIERCVLISPTVYGADNSCMIDALRQQGTNYRGIAVIDDGTSDAELGAMNEAGVRGVRCNFAGFLNMTPDPDLFRRTVARITPLGWHVVVHVLGEDLIEYENLFREVRIPLVIDHMCHLDLTIETDKRALDILMDMLRRDNCWIKISNGDRVSHAGPPDYTDVIPLGRALADIAPDRAIWGTDWPHVLYKKPAMANDGDLLNLLAKYVPDETARNRILVDNPAALYGFNG
ncbi:MAG: amidohydrolase family protein [Rhodospirillales bacterium]|nr:amidohydrolase family protein [Rhodospirillales bacterium]